MIKTVLISFCDTSLESSVGMRFSIASGKSLYNAVKSKHPELKARDPFMNR